MKAIFMGTPVFALNSLNTMISLGIDIALVVTKEDARQGRKMKTGESPVKTRAREVGIDILQSSNLKEQHYVYYFKDSHNFIGLAFLLYYVSGDGGDDFASYQSGFLY